jgi:hypothetical protein
MSTATAPDLLPTEPTRRDFARLAAVVSLERGNTAPGQAPWAPDDVAAKLWQSRNLMPFPRLAHHAMAVAREPRFKGPGAIYLTAAGVITE